ncbi:MAG: hypothetical protein MK135_14655 [Polyangiaceae bacterium]|nr:hypothetical protein [Polyangiaceae bacterium]
MKDYFRLCSTCRVEIGYGEKYYSCSVSTCNRPRTALFFCSVPCWDAHVPEARHKDAWAETETAPSREQVEAEEKGSTRQAVRRVVSVAGVSGDAGAESFSSGAGPVALQSVDESDILVVASKLKKYVKERGGMNTSQGTLSEFSDLLRAVADDAIQEAARHERKTVLDRDVRAAIARFLRPS